MPETGDGRASAAVPLPESRPRLTDKQAIAILAGYFAMRQVTSRVGLVSLPWLLANAVWAIPLLNAQLITVLTASTEARGDPGLLVAVGAGTFLIAIVAGSMLFWTGWRFGPKLAEMGAKPGSLWGSVWNPRQIARAHRLLERYGAIAVFVSRGTGRLVGPVTLVAGSGRMSPRRFFAVYTAASVTWAALVIWLGVRAGDAWPWLPDRIKGFASVSARFGLIALGVLLAVALLAWRTQPAPEPQAETDEDR